MANTKRIKHNDLTHYFLRDREDLPKAYLKKVDKFMWEIRNKLIRKQDAAILYKLKNEKRLTCGNIPSTGKSSSGSRRKKRTSERASKQGNKLGIKRFASQQALNVIPIIRSERRGRLIVCKQFGERAAPV